MDIPVEKPGKRIRQKKAFLDTLELAVLHLPESCKDTLAAMNPFAIAGRYPDSPFPLPTHDEARGYAERVQEVFTCLMRLLSQ